MPSEKRFEMMTSEINPNFLLLGAGEMFKTVSVSGFEVAESFYGIVVQALKILDKGETLAFECMITGESEMHRLQRKSSNVFAYQSSTFEGTFELDMMKVLNLLFKQAPFIPIVGTEGGDLEL